MWFWDLIVYLSLKDQVVCCFCDNSSVLHITLYSSGSYVWQWLLGNKPWCQSSRSGLLHIRFGWKVENHANKKIALKSRNIAGNIVLCLSRAFTFKKALNCRCVIFICWPDVTFDLVSLLIDILIYETWIKKEMRERGGGGGGRWGGIGIEKRGEDVIRVHCNIRE